MKTPNQIPLDKITFPLDNPTWQNWLPTWQGCGPWEIIDVNPPSNDNDNDRPLGRQTFILKISLTPYYSSSWDVTILLYESLETLKQLKNASESFVEAVGPPKMTSAKIRPIISFFRRGCAIFIRIFTPVKTYKPKNPSGWHYLLDEPSPEMDSNPNSNGWTSI